METFLMFILLSAETIGLSQSVTDDTLADWRNAATVCGQDFLSVPTTTGVGAVDISTISSVKRKVHLNAEADVWIGNVQTFYFKDLKTVPRAKDLCVSLTFTSIEETTENETYTYFYNLNVEKCSNTHQFLCATNDQRPGLNDILKTWSRANAICTLWLPDYELLPISRDGIIATDQWKSTVNTPDILHLSLWVRMVVGVSETVYTPVTVPDHILQCGYLTYMGTDILYANCYKQKRPGCYHSNDTAVDATQTSSSRTGDQGPGVYIGVSVAGVVIVVAVVAITAWYIHTRRRGSTDDIKLDNGLPKGGRSFIRNKAEPETTTNDDVIEDNRISRYYKIDPKEVREMLASQAAELNVNDVFDPGYDSIKVTERRHKNTPDVVPEVPARKLPPFPTRGYLTMDGSERPPQAGEDSEEYDTIQRSASAKCFTTSVNIYDTGSYHSGDVTSDSTYDVTFERKPSKRTLIDSYDHVSITSSGTMNRGFCESISENSDGVYAVADVVQNPTYDSCS